MENRDELTKEIAKLREQIAELAKENKDLKLATSIALLVSFRCWPKKLRRTKDAVSKKS